MSRTISSIARLALILVAVFGLLAITTPAGASIDSVTVVPSPSPGTNANNLESVSCVSESWCVAVGEDYSVTPDTLMLLWNGTTWTQMTSPALGGNPNVTLSSVSCATTSWCVAVGTDDSSSPRLSFALFWDGASWTKMTVPAPGNLSSSLRSVSCVSASSCIAVGRYDSFSSNGGYVLSWNGTVWSQSSTPDDGTFFNDLYSVSCLSPTSCIAVGETQNIYGGNNLSVALTWNGSSWTKVTTPVVGNSDNHLNSVSCVSPSSCIAVGTSLNSSFYRETMVLTWNGSAWTVVASPNAGVYDSYLFSVSCTSASSCVAVGQVQDASFQSAGLVLSWDGTAWRNVTISGAETDTQLMSVSCVSSSWCIGAGDTNAIRTVIVAITGAATPTTPVDPLAPAFTG